MTHVAWRVKHLCLCEATVRELKGTHGKIMFGRQNYSWCVKITAVMLTLYDASDQSFNSIDLSILSKEARD